jgi:hypothetical protein
MKERIVCTQGEEKYGWNEMVFTYAHKAVFIDYKELLFLNIYVKRLDFLMYSCTAVNMFSFWTFVRSALPFNRSDKSNITVPFTMWLIVSNNTFLWRLYSIHDSI